MSENIFKCKVYELISSVPAGTVVSYGQVALMCGKPGAARQVGRIAHFGPSNLPWHRIVMADGSMAQGFIPGGPTKRAEILKNEGVVFGNGKVLMAEFRL